MRSASKVSCAAIAIVAWALSGCAPRQPAEVVFRDARFYTLVGAPPASLASEPVAAALAVRAGRIVAIGSEAEVGRWIGPATRVHDLRGATVFPGFVDCHLHLSGVGRLLDEVDLVGTTSFEDVVQRVRERAATLPPGAWVCGRGWDQNDWADARFPDHAELSRAIPEHPVYLRRIDGHAALVDARALDLAGIDAATPDPPGGRIERRADGTPTGVLVDGAVDLVARLVPPPETGQRRARLRAALAHCAAAGLTGVHDAGETRDQIEDARALLAAGELPIRVYAMWGATPDADTLDVAAARAAGPQGFDPSMHLALRAVKFMVDGALGSRGAALLEPYADAPSQGGLPRYTAAAFYDRVRPFHVAGYQIATHCIGDAANRMVLDTYERLQRELPRPDTRHRIEHAQILAATDIPRFAALHVLPSMQPTHCTSDMPWAPQRLGGERIRGAYAWRSLRDTGVLIPAGSDAPVESVAPLLGVYAAVTRQDLEGRPPEGWAPEQRLTRSEALRAFTSWAAFASFSDGDLGTLETGKLADLTIVERDLCTIPAAEIATTRVLMTVVGGEIVFDAAKPAAP